jgi:hypothetical protein
VVIYNFSLSNFSVLPALGKIYSDDINEEDNGVGNPPEPFAKERSREVSNADLQTLAPNSLSNSSRSL